MRSFNKKLLILLISPLVISLSSCNKKEIPPKARVTFDLIGPEKSSEYFDYSFDLKEYINVTDEPNKNILKLSMLLDANISDNSKVEFDKTEYPTQSNLDQENLFKHLGIDGFEKVEVTSPSDKDINDITCLNLGHKTYSSDGTNYDICFVIAKDSGGNSSWSSNFDVGYDDESYYSKTGEHEEWTNKENHKGFDVTANRCLGIIEDYKTRVLDQNSQQIFYIFGHSRGGAVANVLAAKLVDLGYETVSYGLASPAVTTSNTATDSKYKHLYSYICDEDVVTKCLSADWGFKRYGKTTRFSIKDYLKEFKQYNGFGLPSGDTSPIVIMLKNLADGRADFYKITDKYFVASADSLEAINKYFTPFTGEYEELKNFVEVVNDTDSDGNPIYNINTCPGLFTSLFGVVISKMGNTFDSITDQLAPFMEYKYLNCLLRVSGAKITDLLSLNMDYIVCTHFFPSYLTYLNTL